MRFATPFTIVFAAVLAVFAAACNGSPPAKPSANKTPPVKPAAARSVAPVAEAKEEAVEEKTEPVAAAQPALADEVPDQLYAPKVTLTKAHADASLVKVGDTFPQLDLATVDGKAAPLSTLLGKKLTVVVFWSDDLLYAREQFRRLGPEVAGRYANLGVKVVSVNVGQSAADVKKLATEAKVDFPCLVDPEKKAFAQVAKSGLPRTYVLDAQGKVLWFDLEYSRMTRRELHNAVHYYTQSAAPAKKVD